ncbi:MAG: endonuclease III [Ignavibacteriales bacterium]|nr:endonuclease III [Ignavibacteriales bacterium]
MARQDTRARSLRRISLIADALEDQRGFPRLPKRKSRPLDSLIATLLSQNTNDRNSYRAWLSLKRQFPSWAGVHDARWQAIARAIEVGGLKNQKAKRIKLILRTILKERGSFALDFLQQMSDEQAMEYLLAMKGVGSKTAACVLVFSLGRDVFPVDTHIHRICNRLVFVKTKSADETYEAMKPLLPPGRAYSFHVNLIHFGRQTCRSSNPLCGQCILFDECLYPQKHRNLLSTSGTKRQKGTTDFLITEKIANDGSKRRG